MGVLPGWSPERERREPGSLASGEAWGCFRTGPGAGKYPSIITSREPFLVPLNLGWGTRSPLSVAELRSAIKHAFLGSVQAWLRKKCLF